MLKLETVNARGIAALDVEVVGVVVVGVNNSDAKGGGVAEGTKVYAVNVEVAHHRKVAVHAQDGIHAFQIIVQRLHLQAVVENTLPERGAAEAIGERHAVTETHQALVVDREFAVAPVAAQIGAQTFADGKRGLLSLLARGVFAFDLRVE